MSTELVKIPTSKVEITPTYLKITQEISENEYLQIWEYLGHIGNKLMVYVGDLANQEGMIQHGIKSDFYESVKEKTGLKYNSIKMAKVIMSNIDRYNRLYQCGIRHYALVYQMDSFQQRYWLQKCIDEGWSTKTLKHEIYKSLPAPPLPDGKYELVYADPPWAYDTPESTVEVDKHYPTLELDDICYYQDKNGKQVKDLAHINCVLYLWATMGRLNWAFPVIEAWGFKYKTHMVWDKVKHNMGHYCSARHEILIIAGKGDCDPKDMKIANSIDSVQVIEKDTKHSKKPEQFHEIIETLYPDEKKVELFARTKRRDWDVWGNEVWEFSPKTNR